MSRTEVKLAGFGGQGIVLSGFIIGRAISIHEDKHAVLTQSYGPEARGGACAAEIVISDTTIDYPYITVPEILVVMSQEAYRLYHGNLKKKGILLYDQDLVNLNEENNTDKIFAVPATKMAEELGKKIVANIVMLGAFTAITGIVGKDAVEKAVTNSVPKALIDLNLEALQKGYDYGIGLKKKE
jgi:2-oxoglutarate ferredoxin oxidoreductase subunit gamma